MEQFLAAKSVCVIPARFGNSRLFLFPKVKLALKGRHFSDIIDITHGVQYK
jgi:hypothetical protein